MPDKEMEQDMKCWFCTKSYKVALGKTIEINAEGKGIDRMHTATLTCPHCNSKVTMREGT
ncbi:MAG: hypothetical protein V3S43_06450 [Acidimicrobiia bacterium]